MSAGSCDPQQPTMLARIFRTTIISRTGVAGRMPPFGVGASAAIAAIAGWPIFIGPEAMVLAAGFAAVVGIFFGFYPALYASRPDPIKALRFE